MVEDASIRSRPGSKSPIVIALTATPPYDVTQIEWNRYASICGEVDEEISAPELVKVEQSLPAPGFHLFLRADGAGTTGAG